MIDKTRMAQDAAGAGGAFLLAQAAAVNPDAVSSICASIVSALVAATVFMRTLLEVVRYFRGDRKPVPSKPADLSGANSQPPTA
jgi:hypothetical protein